MVTPCQTRRANTRTGPDTARGGDGGRRRRARELRDLRRQRRHQGRRARTSPSWRAPSLCTAEGVFTRSLFAGPSVVLCRRHLQTGSPRAIVTVSKNANVATGPQGERDAHELAELVAAVVGSEPGRRPGGLDRGHRPPRTRWTGSAPTCDRRLEPPGDGRLRLGGPGHHDHRHRPQAGQRPGRRRPSSPGSPRARG